MEFMKEKHPEIGQRTEESGVIDEKTADALQKAVLEFKKTFKA